MNGVMGFCVLLSLGVCLPTTSYPREFLSSILNRVFHAFIPALVYAQLMAYALPFSQAVSFPLFWRLIIM